MFYTRVIMRGGSQLQLVSRTEPIVETAFFDGEAKVLKLAADWTTHVGFLDLNEVVAITWVR